MKIRLILLSFLMTLLMGCGDSEKIIEQLPAAFQDALTSSGCSSYTLIHPDVRTLISCESGESYLLYVDGRMDIDFSIDLETYLEFIYVDPSESYVCEDHERVSNGSFEEGHDLGNNKWGVFENLDGWFANLDEVDAPIEIQNGDNIGGIEASDGMAKLELDSHNKSGFTESDAHVSQNVATNSNKPYLITFDYSARVNNNAATNRIEVLWNGQVVASLNSSNRGWEEFRLTVLGAVDESKLSFRAIGDNDTVGGYIDNVSVTEVCD